MIDLIFLRYMKISKNIPEGHASEGVSKAWPEGQAPRSSRRPIPVMVAAVTRIPAIITPAAIAGRECLNLIPKTKAAAQPDHAPVAGKGMATKIVKARSPYFSKLSL